MERKARSLEFCQKRFMSHVVQGLPDECWLWNGARSGTGHQYGQAGYQGRRYTAHRLAYILFVGPVSDDLEVCHSCDTPLCVNPSHLWLGTHADNMRDMTQKGRLRAACSPGRTPYKLTPENIEQIHALLLQGVSHRSIAAQFKVSQPMISHIKNGKNWTEETYRRLEGKH